MSFCEHCGNEMASNAIYCTKCGNLKIKKHQVSVCWIEQYILSSKTVKIDVDGVFTSELQQGKSVQFTLTEGFHKLLFYTGNHKKCQEIQLPNLTRDIAFTVAINTTWTGSIDVYEQR